MKVLRALSDFVHDFFFDLLLGCSHRHLTRPFTIEKETYMVCLDCGKQLYYSPSLMRPLTTRELRRLRAAQASEVRVMPSPAPVPELTRERARRAHVA